MILALHSHAYALENEAEVRIITDQGERRESRDHDAHVARRHDYHPARSRITRDFVD